MKLPWLMLLFIIATNTACGQIISSLRQRTLELNKDTIKLDTLSIVPGSLSITALDSDQYDIIYPTSTLIIKKRSNQEVLIRYRVFPIDLSKRHQHRSYTSSKGKIQYDPFKINSLSKKQGTIFNDQALQKSGSISRGLNFGNTRDLSVSSNMNLQLAGKIQDIEIAAAITDNNIPIQPEGNTQQLQDFDEVYVRFSKNNNVLVAGDYKFKEQEDVFLRFNKKAQGVQYKGQFKINKKKAYLMDLGVGLAVSRGKFGRNQIPGIEGNQGPYQLKGSENESFIIILSGTEKVYIDGKLMTRGMDNDYVIDYNNGEVTFTNNQLVTKDKRIIVEFQYSDRNYSRTIYNIRDDLNLNDKTKFSFKVYSEQDMKSQQILQTLSPDDIALLGEVGDSIQDAIITRVDSVAFTKNLVLYEKKDSVIEGTTYQDIFLYSNDPLKAFYQLSFSNVGQNKGHYVQAVSTVNGRVYNWVAPENGVPQGSFEPVITLISPKQKQMVTFSVDHKFNQKNRLFIESAVSNDNKNLFSQKDKQDDQGLALKTIYDFTIPLSIKDTGWTITGRQTYSMISKNFRAIERFRSVEFERDWNTEVNVMDQNEHWASLLLELKKASLTKTKIRSAYIDRSSQYKAFKNDLGIDYNLWKGAVVNGEGSLLQTSGSVNYSTFLKHKAELTQSLGPISVAIWEQQENKITKLSNSDSLVLGSTNDNFRQYGIKLSNKENQKTQFGLDYIHRFDYLSDGEKMKLSTEADDYTLSFQRSNSKKTSVIKLKSTLRQLHIKDTTLSDKTAENTLLNRIEYFFTPLKGMINSKTFFELGTGNELKREFTYAEFEPGQGVYIWIDHNQDNVQQLNEFEIPTLATDQPNFLRVFLPSTDFVKTYTNQLTQSLYVNPAKYYKRNSSFKKILTRFSDQAYLRLNQKNTKEKGKLLTIPFSESINDTSLISINSSYRNTLYFNRSNPTFGMNYSVRDNRTKTLLLQGYDARKLSSHSINIRLNAFKFWTIQFNAENQKKERSSEIFSTDNFLVSSNILEPKIHFQKNSKFRITFQAALKDKKNALDLGGQQSLYQKIGWAINYAIPGKGRLNAEFDYITTTYGGEDTGSSPLQFEMLEGLQVGSNYTWTIRFQQTFKNNLQANITYDGRSSPGFKVVHTGGLQVQLLF